jgi:poly [ADP-ribose] polymerase
MALLGDGSLSDAHKNFEKKFKDKSGLKWEDRGQDPKNGKCQFIRSVLSLDS